MKRLLLALSLLTLTASAQPTTVYEVWTWRPQGIHEVIDAVSAQSAGQAAVAKIVIRGTGVLRTEGIRLLAGLEIECEAGTGFHKPSLALRDHATQGLFIVPDDVQAGGGGGRFYQHHTKITGCTVDGNKGRQEHAFPVAEIYNGGFQMRFEDVQFRDCAGPCVFIGRTALNVYLDNVDFSGCSQEAIRAELDMFSGVLAIEGGQIDNCGSAERSTVYVEQKRKSAWQGAPGIVSIRDYQFEYQTTLPRAVIETNISGQTGLGVIYDGISVDVAYKDWGGRSVQSIILDSSSGTGVAHHDIRSVRSAGEIQYGFIRRDLRIYPRDQNRTIVIGSAYVQ